MTLSDRLAAAARVREGAARGTTAAPTSSLPSPTSTATATRRAGTTTISPATERAVAADKRIRVHAIQPAAWTEPPVDAEANSVCPTCGRVGELGILDLPGRTADWSCLTCGTLWQVDLPRDTP